VAASCLVGWLLANDTPTMIHRPTSSSACRWLTDPEAGVAYPAGKTGGPADEVLCNSVYAFLCKYVSSACAKRAAAASSSEAGGKAADGTLVYW
jgi:hypothetical protein